MVAKDYNKSKGSAKAEVGEIDTSAPFQSVKDAVSLFGEGAFSGEKPVIRKARPHSAERVLAKETQLHLSQKQLNKLKEQLENAETTKAQALTELDRAKRTVEDLNEKLKRVNESKESAIMATEVSKHQVKLFAEANNADSEATDVPSSIGTGTATVEYATVVAELNAAKQELRKIRQEYDASIKVKDVAAMQTIEAEDATRANTERVGEVSKEIAGIRDSIEQVKIASARSKEEETEISAVKDKRKELYKTRLEELSENLVGLKQGIDPEFIKNLESQLGETSSEIEVLQKEIDSKRAADINSVKTVASELDGAKESLGKVVEEERSLKSLLEKLKLELGNIKKENSGFKEKEAETESTAGNLNVKLRKAKVELEEALAEEAKARGISDEMIATIHQLTLESQNVKDDAEQMKQQAEELKREAEVLRIELEEADKKLRITLNEAEEAKAAEATALSQVQMLSEKTDAARSSTSEPGAQITISREEYESLTRKVEQSKKLADMKVSAAAAQAEAMRASENEALKRLEATQKEIEAMKDATREALKKAEMAEAAKRAVEGELRKWREREQKKAAEAASRMLAETEPEKALESSPQAYHVQKQENRNLEKSKTSVTKKVLMPSLSNVFLEKKIRFEGSSPSHR